MGLRTYFLEAQSAIYFLIKSVSNHGWKLTFSIGHLNLLPATTFSFECNIMVFRWSVVLHMLCNKKKSVKYHSKNSKNLVTVFFKLISSKDFLIWTNVTGWGTEASKNLSSWLETQRNTKRTTKKTMKWANHCGEEEFKNSHCHVIC